MPTRTTSAGVGALLLLMAVHFDLSVIAIVGILLGRVEMMVIGWMTLS